VIPFLTCVILIQACLILLCASLILIPTCGPDPYLRDPDPQSSPA
jgi:hypothetical protein